MTLREKTEDIYKLMGEGKLLEAFDKYYGEEVIITEPRGTWKGKAECRAHEEEFLGMIKEFHGMEVHAITSNEEKEIVMHETSMDVTFQDGNRVQMEQVGVQKWKNGKIIHERFYYQ